MRFFRYVNVGRMYVRLNGEPFQEVDCFMHLGSAEGGCEKDIVHTMNEGYKV